MEEKLRLQLTCLSGWVRKPTTWEEVGDPIPTKWLEDLKQYTAAELGIAHNISAMFTKVPEDSIFLVGYRGSVYLVRTEGADYARYVRYVGTTMPQKVNVVTLADEHQQPIEVLHLYGQYYWVFYSVAVQTLNGPFETFALAVDAATQYCTEAAVG